MFKIKSSQQNTFTKIIILTIAILGFSFSNSLFAHFNLALGKPATQSSILVYNQIVGPSLVVDGNTSGNDSDNSMTHTRAEDQPWWSVDLTEDAFIDYIVIYNRTDYQPERLSNYSVKVSEHKNFEPVTYAATFTDYPDPSQSINLNNIRGRYIRISLLGHNHLSLAEVEVYGRFVSTDNTETENNYFTQKDNTIIVATDTGLTLSDGTLKITKGDVNVENGHLNISDRSYLNVEGNLDVENNGELNVKGSRLNIIRSSDNVAGNLNIIDSNLNIKKNSNLNIEEDGNINVKSGGKLNIESGGKLNITGSTLSIESGGLKVIDSKLEIENSDLNIKNGNINIANGSIKIGNDNNSCTTANEGAVRYDFTTKNMQFCNGVGWQAFSLYGRNEPLSDYYFDDALEYPYRLGSANSVGGHHTCALKLNNKVQCWGRNNDGQTNVPATLTAVKQITTGYAHTCALIDNNDVACWGWNVSGQTDVPDGLKAKQIAAGGHHTCALTLNNDVVCWGDSYSQTGMPATLTAKQIATGESHTCALTYDNDVACWGSLTSVPDGLRAKQITTGWHHACALTDDNDVVCWGWSNYDQSNVPATLTTAKQIATGRAHVCALTLNNRVECRGQNYHGQGNVPDGLRAKQITAGFWHTCALKLNNTIQCWGDYPSGIVPTDLKAKQL